MDVRYKTQVHVEGGRRGGHARSDDGVLDITFEAPNPLASAPSGTNPEQLFAAGFAACFESTIRGAARRARIQLSESWIDSEVAIARNSDEEQYGLMVTLNVGLPEVNRETAEQLLSEAKANCPYSRATKGNIPVEVVLVASAENAGEAATATGGKERRADARG